VLYFSKIKLFVIYLIISFLSLFALTNFFENNENFLLSKKINLGLDLQGGSYLLLEVDSSSVETRRLQSRVIPLKKKLKDHNLNYKDLILVGFSQGTMIALNLALTIKEEVRGVLGYSGGVILTKSGKIEINSKPKVCLVHGKEDEVVPKKMMEATEIVLKDSNIDVNTHLIENLGHSINQEGLEIGQNFLVNYLLKC